MFQEPEFSNISENRDSKKLLIFQEVTFQAPSSKNKKIHSEKNSLYFRKWDLLVEILKNSYIFSKESFCYISRKTLHFLAQGRKIKIIHPKKISYISLNGNPEKISGGTSKAPKTKIYYIFPKNVMNKFFKKYYPIIVSKIYIN